MSLSAGSINTRLSTSIALATFLTSQPIHVVADEPSQPITIQPTCEGPAVVACAAFVVPVALYITGELWQRACLDRGGNYYWRESEARAVCSAQEPAPEDYVYPVPGW